MDNKEFMRKTIELCKRYKELRKEGIIGVDTAMVQMDSENLFDRFDKSECQKSYHTGQYPTCYSIIKNEIKFLCLTGEPWEEHNGTTG